MTSFGKYEYSTAVEPIKLQKPSSTSIIFQDHTHLNMKKSPFEAVDGLNGLKTCSFNGATHKKKTLLCYFEIRKSSKLMPRASRKGTNVRRENPQRLKELPIRDGHSDEILKDRLKPKEGTMYGSEHYYKLAKMRQEEILREVDMDRRLAASRSKSSHKVSPRIAWALVGPVLAIVVLSIIV